MLDRSTAHRVSSDDSPTVSGQARYEQAKRLIPGGTQLLSKRPEQFAPGQWPPYYRQAQGCEIIDLDGHRYLDMSIMGIGACLLGYNDPEVTAAVIRRVEAGSMCTLNNPEEVELARLLIEIHPWAENVRYARTGGEAMAMAVRIARASTRRDLIAFCGYHGWHDWYLAANRGAGGTVDQLQAQLLPGLDPGGVPVSLAGTAIPFSYNQADQLSEIVRQHGSRLAAVIMEPTRSVHPDPGFLQRVRQLCDEAGAVLVFDEITVGWRMTLGGAHLLYGVMPDIAVFAKALGNGHPMAAIIGRSAVMQAAQESFISSTYWTEGVGPAAALATLRKMQRIDLPGHLVVIATAWREGWGELAAKYGLPLRITGHPGTMRLAFDHPQALELETLFTARMLGHRILAGPSFYPSWAHTVEHVQRCFAAAAEVCEGIAAAIRSGDVLAAIGGPVRQSGFARLT